MGLWCVARSGTTREPRKPGPQHVGLIVEVSDSSLADDRAMARIYGPAGVPIYWIVNLIERRSPVALFNR
jgi:Uma2 family endonuclease